METQNMTDEKLSKYEIDILFEDGDLNGISEARNILIKYNADIKNESSKRIKLAYPIKKNDFANMVMFFIETYPSQINLISKDLRIQNIGLRTIVIKNPPERKTQTYRPISQKQESPIPERPAAVPATDSKKEGKETITNEELEEKLKEILG